VTARAPKPARLWVMEWWLEGIDKWMPTLCTGITRAECRCDAREWRQRNPHERVRIRAYTSEFLTRAIAKELDK